MSSNFKCILMQTPHRNAKEHFTLMIVYLHRSTYIDVGRSINVFAIIRALIMMITTSNRSLLLHISIVQ